MSYPGDGASGNGLMPSAPQAMPTAPQGADAASPQGPQALKPPGSPQAPGGDDMMGHMTGQFDKMAQHYSKLKEAKGRTTVARSVLDSLAKMGDMVTQKDVVDGASKLVASGLGAEAIAGMLADMPPDGAALQGWVAQHDQELRQREAQLQQATQMVRFQMGTSALKLLATHAMHGTHLPPAADNALMNGGPQ